MDGIFSELDFERNFLKQEREEEKTFLCFEDRELEVLASFQAGFKLWILKNDSDSLGDYERSLTENNLLVMTSEDEKTKLFEMELGEMEEEEIALFIGRIFLDTFKAPKVEKRVQYSLLGKPKVES